MNTLSKKVIKRKNIAKSCCDIFTNDNFNKISISQIAATAGIGKGTIYEYFKNKEDIVFELMSCLQEDYDEKLNNKLKNTNNNYDKILTLFDIFISKEKLIQTQKEIYKQFLIICLTNPDKKIKKYNSTLRNKYISILNQILNNQSISIQMYDTIVGFFIASNSLDNYDLE